jgi:hypothetical protein
MTANFRIRIHIPPPPLFPRSFQDTNLPEKNLKNKLRSNLSSNFATEFLRLDTVWHNSLEQSWVPELPPYYAERYVHCHDWVSTASLLARIKGVIKDDRVALVSMINAYFLIWP